MPWTITASGHVELGTGKVSWDKPALVTAALKRRKGRVTVTITTEELTRSEQAHKYYFGVVLKLIAAETGHSIDDLHEVFKAEWNSKTVLWTDPATGEMTERRIPQTTTKLKVSDFYQYVEEVRFYAAESLGIVTPEPDPEYWKKREGKAA